jgi:hypothetical protein
LQDNALILRATVAEICGWRQKALDLYAQAHSELNTADATIKSALMALTNASGSTVNRYNYHSRTEDTAFIGRLEIPKLEDYEETVRRMVDRQVWARVIELSNIGTLMDKKAKDEFTKDLMENPPPATEDNIRATVQSLMGQRDLIFKRGVAECFSNLDRRFKSHDGWKIGGRVILDRAFDDSGHWNYHRNQQDVIADIERVFFILDGQEPPKEYYGLKAAIDKARGNRWGPQQCLVETEFFKVRTYENGNAHIWFMRDDLLKKVNQLLGEYYDAPIPEERAASEDTGFSRPKTAIAKNFAFYPSPKDVVERVVEKAKAYTYPCSWGREDGPLRILEPSAGTGNLARPLAETGNLVDCVEYQPELANELRRSGTYNAVYCFDFLAWQPDPDNLYDRVILNPPFDTERDIDHVMHAIKFLKPDGKLVAVMSAGTCFRETTKAKSFRKIVDFMKGRFTDLPERSFASLGTNINTVILELQGNRQRPY